MNSELMDEIDDEIDFLVKVGFYDKDDILETIIDEFIDFDLNEDEIYNKIMDKFNDHQKKSNSADFTNLKEGFNKLTKEGIVSIHNCGYDIQEGVEDSFEIYTHLINNNYSPKGFCFYTLSGIEEVFENNVLTIAFGLFDETDKKASRELANNIISILEEDDFNVEWSNNPDKPIKIKDFKWEKIFDDTTYFMEGAYEDFIKYNSKEY